MRNINTLQHTGGCGEVVGKKEGEQQGKKIKHARYGVGRRTAADGGGRRSVAVVEVAEAVEGGEVEVGIEPAVAAVAVVEAWQGPYRVAAPNDTDPAICTHRERVEDAYTLVDICMKD